MGTRSLTHVTDESGKVVLTMYRQFDGYPSRHGLELAQFLSGFEVVNWYQPGETAKVANGMGCLAAQLVAHFKSDTGGFYLMPPKSTGHGEEYIYSISVKDKELRVKVRDVWEKRTLKDAPVDEFLKWCEREK